MFMCAHVCDVTCCGNIVHSLVLCFSLVCHPSSSPRGEYSLPFYTGGPCQYLGSEILQQNHVWGL